LSDVPPGNEALVSEHPLSGRVAEATLLALELPFFQELVGTET
jgi:hypothetical protein